MNFNTNNILSQHAAFDFTHNQYNQCLFFCFFNKSTMSVLSCKKKNVQFQNSDIRSYKVWSSMWNYDSFPYTSRKSNLKTTWKIDVQMISMQNMLSGSIPCHGLCGDSFKKIWHTFVFHRIHLFRKAAVHFRARSARCTFHMLLVIYGFYKAWHDTCHFIGFMYVFENMSSFQIAW